MAPIPVEFLIQNAEELFGVPRHVAAGALSEHAPLEVADAALLITAWTGSVVVPQQAAEGPGSYPDGYSLQISNGAAIWAPSANTGYLAIDFGGDDVKGELPRLRVGDGTNFTPLGGAIPGIPRSRDHDIILWRGLWWMIYTKGPTFGTISTGFGLSVSVHPKQGWTQLPDVSFASISGVKRVWGPHFIEDGNTLRVLCAASTADNDLGPFVMYESHPTNTAMTAWSNPVNVSQGLPVSVFDMTAWKVGSQWITIYKDNNTEFGCRATSNSALGPWTVTHTGDWMGAAAALGTNPVPMEGFHRELLPWGKMRLFFDRYHGPGYAPGDFSGAATYYMDTADLTGASGWSAPVRAHTLGRHARVRRVALPPFLLEGVQSPRIELIRNDPLVLAHAGYNTPVVWQTVFNDTDGMVDLAVDGTGVIIRSGGSFVSTLNGVFLAQGAGDRFAAIRYNRAYPPGVTDKRPGVRWNGSVNVPVDVAMTLGDGRELRRGDVVDAVFTHDGGSGTITMGTVPPPRLKVIRTGS